MSLLILGHAAANAGATTDDAGSLACVTDKWDEKEVEKGHKLVDYAGRCVAVPDDPAALKYTEVCAGKYEFMPDESWKGTAKCTWTFKDGDEVYDTFEEGSHLKHPHTRSPAAPENTWRKRQRHLFVREPDRCSLRRQIRGQDAIALEAFKMQLP